METLWMHINLCIWKFEKWAQYHVNGTQNRLFKNGIKGMLDRKLVDFTNENLAKLCSMENFEFSIAHVNHPTKWHISKCAIP